MVEADCATHLRVPPSAADPQQAAVGYERWLAALSEAGGAELRRRGEAVAVEESAKALLAAVFGNSPYLTLLAERLPGFTVDLLRDGADAARARVFADLAVLRREAAAGRDPARPLRVAKRQIALLTAVADIAGLWTLEQVTRCLSDFAEAALRIACRFQLADAARRGILRLTDEDDPEWRSGLIIIGMGKLGARELNYSSDIDLIVLFDPERIQGIDAAALQTQLNRLTRAVVRLMADRTGEGYVFRTDLRLRPDPGSTPPAISVLGAEIYYETLGQNWERAALIKARPVAGDIGAGEAFINQLTPFIWRKNLDFAAIQDIHSIKRQINAYRGGGRVALAGHNIKLGRGGIREIEFFVQTQQLIWGGRLPSLRIRGTVAALGALAEAGKIDPAVAERLTAAYGFLRRLEHRLQMVDDAQTHTIPTEPERIAALATFLGYAGTTPFEKDLLAVLQTVETHYAELFEDAPSLSLGGSAGGNLVFTGVEPDPDTLETLTRLGFSNALAVDAAVRGWHHGRARAMRSPRARELLTELIPALLRELSQMPDPDAAFLAFDKFLYGLPTGVPLFAMWYAHPELLRLVVEILGVAPRLGDHLSRRPSLLDSVLSADFFEPPPPLPALRGELNRLLADVRDAEDLLDRCRRWANDRKFQVGVQSLRGLLDTTVAGEAWSNIAEASVQALLPAIEVQFAAHHGGFPGCELAIIAMGKLGSREMTAASDLDLIFVYGAPPDAGLSSGARPLSAAQYFARLSQRLINALTAQTSEGQLYAVDMRLRPSGKAGPIAVSFPSFRSYQEDQAWTWERMALTRARVIAGSPGLKAQIEQVIRQVLTRPRDPAALIADVADMRARMAREHGSGSIWDVKHRRGGLIDVEFLCQSLQLLSAHDHPQVLAPNNADALANLAAAGVLDAGTAATLTAALRLWQAVQARLRLTISGDIAATSAADAPKALKRALSDLEGLAFDALVERMDTVAAEVRKLFAQLIEQPAQRRQDARALQ